MASLCDGTINAMSRFKADAIGEGSEFWGSLRNRVVIIVKGETMLKQMMGAQ